MAAKNIPDDVIVDEDTNGSKMSHQALRKDELRTLALEYERVTLNIIEQVSNPPEGTAVGLRWRLLVAQVQARVDHLVRLQAMGVTSGSVDWSILVEDRMTPPQEKE